MSFSVYNTALGYTVWISKTFITGTPTATNHVHIGATLADTMVNLMANLNANDGDLNASFEASGTNGFYVNLFVPETYVYNPLTDPGSTITTFSYEDVTVPDNDVLEPLNLKDISIRIFDTYINDRILIEELAGANACKIDWNAGDDLYTSLMVSKLVFNMLVPEADDAHFIHLFSGDEQRYRVEVIAIDADDNEQMIWQGFLLPDQYNEPYKNVSFFVDFTATDMIGALKGKYLPQWYYQNSFPVGQLLAYMLGATGLQQNLIVKPSVVPADPVLGFENMVVDLNEYYDGGKLKDLHHILEKVLFSVVSVIYSYRGYWFIEGITRRKDVTSTALQFDTTGTRIQDIEVEKNVVDCGYKLQPTPNFTALTPFRKVNVNFTASGTKNLYSDNVAKIDDDKNYTSMYAGGYFTGTIPALPITYSETYGTYLLNNWYPHLNGDFIYLGMIATKLLWKIINPSSYSGASYSGYNYTAAMSLANYIECPEQPFVKKGVKYEFEVTFKVEKLNFEANNTDVTNRLNTGELDSKLFPFQLFIAGVEKFSNREGFGSADSYRYKITDNSEEHRITLLNILDGYDHELTFNLKFTFRPEEDGVLAFRILMPRIASYDKIRVGGTALYTCELLKLTAIDGLAESDDTIATRDINYTQELDYELGISCTQDNSVVNSFALNRPKNQNYFKTVPRADTPYEMDGYHTYTPNIALQLQLATWKTTDLISTLLFRKRFIDACFLHKVSGEEIPFTSLWVYFNNPVSRMGYLTAYDGYPNIPKGYKAYPSVDADDVLKFMQVEYAAEDYTKRLDWKLYGSDEINSFTKTVAKALHGVRPDMCYRLEASALELLFPDCLIGFYFDDDDRNFIPTTLNLDLFGGKTSFVATEAKFTEFNDLNYE